MIPKKCKICGEVVKHKLDGKLCNAGCYAKDLGVELTPRAEGYVLPLPNERY